MKDKDIDNLFVWADKNEIPALHCKSKKRGYIDICGEGIPRDKDQLMALDRLYLNGYNIKKLPKELFYLVNLKELHLRNNQLQEIPVEIQNLINLEELE